MAPAAAFATVGLKFAAESLGQTAPPAPSAAAPLAPAQAHPDPPTATAPAFPAPRPPGSPTTAGPGGSGEPSHRPRLGIRLFPRQPLSRRGSALGMTSWTPQTGKRFSAWIYQHDVNSIVGFRATHQASVWRGDYGQFSLMPMSGELSPDVEDRRTTFSREREAASPPSTGRTSTSTTSTWRCPRP